LNMCLFEKAYARLNSIWNISSRQLQLQFDRMIMRAIQDGHFLKRRTFVAELQDASGDKCRLLINVGAGNQSRFEIARTTHGLKYLRKLAAVAGDRCICEAKYLGSRAVVGFEFINGRFRVTLWKLVDVSKLRSSPRKDRLSIVADDHNVAVLY